MERDELELFEKSLGHATSSSTGEALDAALDELGWRDALAADRRAAVSTLFALQGAAGATSSALDQVVLDALGVEVLGALGLDAPPAAGVVLPGLGRWDAPGDVRGEGLAVRGLATAGLARGGTAVVVARAEQGTVAAVVDTTDLALRPIRGLDPRLGLVEVGADRLRATTRSMPATAWEDAVAAGQLAVAHELVGAARTMLQLARDHAVERVQFGQPIAAFQAVRHRLADTLVAIEAADGAAGAAWDDGTPFTAALAKSMAGRAARTAARHCQQVLAGIGFTTEHPFHLHLRRVVVLDQMLGASRSLTRRLGEDLLESRRLPSILPL